MTADGRRLGSPPRLRARSRLKRRSDFLRAAKGRRVHGRGFTLQAVDAEGAAPTSVRIGFTVTKKLGGAVVRNRIRRRLKEALRTIDALPARPGRDYVVVARIEALRLEFARLQAGLVEAISRADSGEGPRGRRRRRSGDA